MAAPAPEWTDAAPRIRVAVILVNYRSAALTVGALDSLQGERHSAGLSIHAIVVENASGDAPALAQAIEERDWGTGSSCS